MSALVLCGYAACGKRAESVRDGYDLCRWHAVVHDDEVVGSERREVIADPDRAEALQELRAMIAGLHAEGLTDTAIGRRLVMARQAVGVHRRALGLEPNGAPPALPNRNGQRIDCGTRYGYQLHKKGGEPVCGPCLSAQRTYDRERQRQRRAAAKAQQEAAA